MLKGYQKLIKILADKCRESEVFTWFLVLLGIALMVAIVIL